jgi:hypothetical protein
MWCLQDSASPFLWQTVPANAKILASARFFCFVRLPQKASFFRRAPKQKTLSQSERVFALDVVPPGIEPGTQGFSVLCSTD